MAKGIASELTIYKSGITDIPGWSSLSQGKQRWLEQTTENIKRYQMIEAISSVGECWELLQIDRGLAGEELKMTTYLKFVFPKSERSGWKKLQQAKELEQHWPKEIIEAIVLKGAALLHGSSGIQAGDLIRVAKRLPAPSTKEAKTIEAFIENDVRNELRREKQERRRGPAKPDRDEALRQWIILGRRLVRELNLKKPEQRFDWMKQGVGILMDVLDVSAPLTARRIPVNGFLPKRGRPRKAPSLNSQTSLPKAH